MTRWVLAAVIGLLAVLMSLPLVTSAGRHLKKYFKKEVSEVEEKNNPWD